MPKMIVQKTTMEKGCDFVDAVNACGCSRNTKENFTP
jgi:hypothetical protein